MSFAEKISAIMARPGQDPNAKDDVPWYLRYGSRVLGTVGGFLAIFLATWNVFSIITLDIMCVIAGMWQILAGFVLICCEAPCCCMFIDYVQTVSDMVDRRPLWQKAAAYCSIALPPIIMCFGMSTLFGSGLIFGTGVLYGMMSLGKKGSPDDMRAAAQAEVAPSTTTTTNQPRIHTSMKSSLVDNAQGMSFTGTPDSNV